MTRSELRQLIREEATMALHGNTASDILSQLAHPDFLKAIDQIADPAVQRAYEALYKALQRHERG